MRTSASDTLEATSSSHGSRGNERSLFLRWVFPETAPPALELNAVGTRSLSIGRDPQCTVVLPGSTEVSRRHSTIRREGSLISITDLSSRNGTFVNGVRVSTAPLQLGDVVRIGSSVALVVSELGPFECLAPNLFGGPKLAGALTDARGAAVSALPIVIEGATGTGKEGVASAIHHWSGRHGPFVAVNCAALPLGLAEAELFGYRRGAFTGADRPTPGYIRSAAGGTLFLDEVCELPLPLQAKLLRVLELREVQPLGEQRPIAVDFRIVTAAQESLQRAVSRGAFRGDLFARLATVTIQLPPLAARREDVPFLFAHLLAARAGRALSIDPRTIETLCLYPWPYNVRELARVSDYVATLHANEPSIKVRHLPPHLRPAEPSAPAVATGEVSVEKLSSALLLTGGNVKQAAELLGVSRQRVYRAIQEHPELELAVQRTRAER